ncbi:unnamed protein product [Mytilus coruscus]|uniref:Uncharacterized protein n=1 Tax=Mytilus coruscus TaxID=42192 RepID=A0A6J8BBE2_MYTCO|nr:unnamed protein product [Mytilus coruscus]
MDATPSGEVQVRVKKRDGSCRDERQVMGNIRPNKNADDLILIEEPNGGVASGDRTAAGSVARECTVNQQVSHGRGDTFSGYFADSSVQERFGDQCFSHQRENFSSPVFTKSHVEGANVLQGISHGPQWTNAMPSGGMQGSNVTNNRYENNLRTNPLNNFAHNSNSAYARGNKKAVTYDGFGSWQDYIVHFELIAEINGWDENTQALELATCLRESAQAILSDMRPDLRRSYAHLIAAFTLRFQPSNQAELYRAQMKGKSRNKDQSLPELAQDIKSVTRLAYPTAPIEGKPNSIDDSVRIGLEFEAFTSGHRRKFNSRAALRMQSGISDDEEGPEIHMNSIIDRLAKIENSPSQQKPSLNQKLPASFVE